ncbi:hypothetical protein Ahy_B09g099141 [Arachis hypogaea]|uniref:Uncharacterized protein n=1 Tax=Arachis hypogaea TaxID=3818 RepID=A0A444XT03_ARAHY|nr:hypothetical protein Ahy_B09g099141 [Arachis hypogaea]
MFTFFYFIILYIASKSCTKGTRVEPPRQQPPTAPPASSPSADDDWLIPLLPSNGGVSAAAPLQPFRLPRSEPRPEPQTTNGVQVTQPYNEDMDPEANEVDSFDEHIDRIMMFSASDAEKCKARKTTKFWDVDLIDSGGIVKQAKMSVREAMERSLNGSKIILRFNKELQVVRDEAGLLSGILGALGCDYSKFPICEKSWTKAKYKQNALNQKKQLYTHTGGSKSLAKARKEDTQKQGRRVGRGEVWILTHKRRDGTYIHEEGQRIVEKISEIEQLDETTRILSENDSLTQALGKERSSRVRGIGFGQHQVEVTVEKLRRKAVEDEVTEKLKKKAMEDEIAAEKTKRQALESVLSYVVQ